MSESDELGREWADSTVDFYIFQLLNEGKRRGIITEEQREALRQLCHEWMPGV